MATAADGERRVMGYLRQYEHDIFVSYAHAEALNDWSKRLVEEARKLVATGLGLRQAKDVDLWMDYKISGNAPLTGQLRDKVEKAGVLLVLMSEWYLESSWCRDELGWFFDAVRQKRADRPVFVVRVRATDHSLWPDVFKDECGHPLIGYDFVRDAEDNSLGLPKGHPSPEYASDGKDFYMAVGKLASDIVAQLKALAQSGARAPAPAPALREAPTRGERIFLAAAPAEDVDDLRAQLAGLLRAQGCVVLPENNPVDVDQVHEQASEWISNCDKFVQVLGSTSGAWRHDETGFVMYQHELAKKNGKPIFVYRAPSLETSRVRKPEYRAFLERFDQTDTGGLASFAEQVAKVVESPPAGGETPRSVFMMASARDESLEREMRRLLGELDISVFPLARRARSGREVASVLDEGSSFLEIIKRCGAILLINGNVKEEDDLWIDGRVADIKFDIQRKLGSRLKCAIFDAPIEPRLESFDDVSVFACDSPTLKRDLQGWLRTLSSTAIQLGRPA
jgi:hypothetical protein